MPPVGPSFLQYPLLRQRFPPGPLRDPGPSEGLGDFRAALKKAGMDPNDSISQKNHDEKLALEASGAGGRGGLDPVGWKVNVWANSWLTDCF